MGRYILDSPDFFREIEVKYPYDLYGKNVMYVVIHVDEDEIDTLLKKKIRSIKEEGSMWEKELIKDATLHAEYAKEYLSSIRQTFEVLPDVPITIFRQIVRDTIPKVKDVSKNKPKLEEPIDVHREWFEKLVKVTEKVHKRIAERYNLSYDDIVKDCLLYTSPSPRDRG